MKTKSKSKAVAGDGIGRVRQRDIAEAAGVHRTTVCLALKNHPGIPEETRERIVRLAEEMGYTPDPMLAALASYRTSKRPAAFHGMLGWLVNSSGGYVWNSFPHYQDYFDGACERARRCGYALEVFDLNGEGMSPNRVVAILRARNIDGLLLCPQPEPEMSMDFPWEQFSSVTFGYTLARPRMHMVSSTHHRNMVRAMRELRRRGYARIGFVFSETHDSRTDRNFWAGYLAEALGYELRLPAMPPFMESFRTAGMGGERRFRAWLRKHQPDAIVTGEFMAFERLEEMGWRVPGELGVVCPTLPSRDTRLAGVVEDSRHIGAVAVDALVAAVQRGERGGPEQPQRILVEGLWHEGVSLRMVCERQ
ncbi:LacI family transcriptional regulator [Opitutaceae bacterium TAV4]|nr:LacI family transcriptional regulator [Opitutaceae bacterium TAV4]RRJ99919.1 LacI family transcriptional regulator [Opitutaceae bacterium TAV3]